MKSRSPILLVEDDLVDAMTVKRAFSDSKIENELIHAKNGEQALEILLEPNRETPCMIMVDLNMPRMNGVEFLKERSNHDQLKLIPTVVLTTSNNNTDKRACYELGISGYFVKPIDYQEFLEIVRTLDKYWTLSELAEME